MIAYTAGCGASIAAISDHRHGGGNEMSRINKRMRKVGYGLHLLIGGVLIVAAIPKLTGLAPADHVEKMGIAEHVRIVGAGELVTGVMLVAPPTFAAGILLTSSFWGGAISVHMTHGQSYWLPSALLVLSWVGAYLRNPVFFGNFRSVSRTSHAFATE
jgi:hypothetical protein